jgi:lipid-A-disaccharide synthase-like uncharacterized protein
VQQIEALWSWALRELQQPLVIFGFAAQFVFFLRFVVQWFESERRGRSHIPIAFWYLSILGGMMILVYATMKQDIVFIAASILSLFIYLRNLMLIYRRHARVAERRRQRALIADGESLEEATLIPPPEGPVTS